MVILFFDIVVLLWVVGVDLDIVVDVGLVIVDLVCIVVDVVVMKLFDL